MIRLRRAFSLIEVLVVIGIIAVMIAILLPALAAARERAKTIQCAAQLHQLGTGFFAYAAQNRGALPPWSGWHIAGGNGTGDDEDGPGWTEILAPVYASPMSKVYDCPSFPEGYRINYFLSVHWLAKNDRVSWLMTQIHNSSQFVLSGDCTGETLYPVPFGSRTDKSGDDCDKDDAVFPALKFALDPGGGLSVHHGGNNVLFADGHVEWKKKFSASEMTFDPSKMLSWEDVTGD